MDSLGRMVGQSREHVCEPGVRINVVELAGLDQRIDSRGSASPFIGACKEPVLASDGNLAVILPMSGRMSWSDIAGIRCTDRGCVVFRASGAHRVSWCTSS